MIRFLNWRPARIIGAALVVLFAAAFIAGPAAGQGLSIANSVQAGEVVDNDLLLTGFEGVIDGRVIGNVFATGKEVTVNGEIEGSLFVVGDKVTVNGHVSGGTYVVGVSLDLGSSSAIDLNLYFLGISLRTESGAVIGRNLVIMAFSANLAGEVGRDTRAVVGLLEFLRLISERLGQRIRGKPVVELAPNEVRAAASENGAQILGRPSIMPRGLLSGRSSLQTASSDGAPEILLNPGGLPSRTASLQAVSSDEALEILLNCIRALISFLLVEGLML